MINKILKGLLTLSLLNKSLLCYKITKRDYLIIYDSNEVSQFVRYNKTHSPINNQVNFLLDQACMGPFLKNFCNPINLKH